MQTSDVICCRFIGYVQPNFAADLSIYAASGTLYAGPDVVCAASGTLYAGPDVVCAASGKSHAKWECFRVLLVEDIERRQADVRDFPVIESDFVVGHS
jgi:hypothetical protein